MTRLIAFVVLAAPLVAHDLFLLPSSFYGGLAERITIVITAVDDFTGTESAPPLERLRDTDLITPTAVYNITNLHASGKTIAGETSLKLKGTLILTARTMPLIVDVEAQKFRDYLTRNRMTDALSQHPPDQPARERHSEYAKVLIQSDAPDDFFSHVVGFMIEIVPEKNPYTLHAGDDLPVQVLLRGKPAPEVHLEAFRTQTGETPARVGGRTDATGHITIPISGPGIWRFRVVSIHKCSDPTIADCWESFWGSLAFEIK